MSVARWYCHVLTLDDLFSNDQLARGQHKGQGNNSETKRKPNSRLLSESHITFSTRRENAMGTNISVMISKLSFSKWT